MWSQKHSLDLSFAVLSSSSRPGGTNNPANIQQQQHQQGEGGID